MIEATPSERVVIEISAVVLPGAIAPAVAVATAGFSLLTAPAVAPIQVSATSGAASLVSIGGSASTTLTIAQGEQTIDLPLAISGARGAALLFFEFEGQRRELLVIVGEPSKSELPLLTAPVVGIQIQQ